MPSLEFDEYLRYIDQECRSDASTLCTKKNRKIAMLRWKAEHHSRGTNVGPKFTFYPRLRSLTQVSLSASIRWILDSGFWLFYSFLNCIKSCVSVGLRKGVPECHFFLSPRTEYPHAPLLPRRIWQKHLGNIDEKTFYGCTTTNLVLFLSLVFDLKMEMIQWNGSSVKSCKVIKCSCVS